MPPSSSSSSSVSNPKVGTRVRIQGLQGRADLNGRIGSVIRRLDKKSGRIGVRVLITNLTTADSLQPESISIKPVNIIVDATKLDAPETFLDGFDVVDSGDVILGRISVATKDFSEGDLILAESPTFVFDPRKEFEGMMSEYIKCTPSTQAEIMDMFCPPIEGSSFTKPAKVQQLEMKRRMLAMAHRPYASSLSLETAQKLLRILDTNAHSYSREFTSEIVYSQAHQPHDDIALFARGCKVEHSCAPTVSFHTQHGKLIYRATRPIAKGSRISISYMSTTLEHPRDQRREFLEENKEFTCYCSRCTGPDECNPYYSPCQTCNNKKAVVFSYEEKDKSEYYKCVTCQSTIAPSMFHSKQQNLEFVFQESLDGYENAVHTGRAIHDGERWMAQMVKLQTEMAEKLHPLHWLHVKGFRVMSSGAASFAMLYMHRGGQSGRRRQQQQQSAEAKRFLYCSTLAQLQQAYWVQRIAGIVYQDVSLKDAAFNTTGAPVKNKFSTRPLLKDLQVVVDQLVVCQQSGMVPDDGMAHPIFHAGQDWLLTGDTKQVAALYKAFLPLFQQWGRLSEENRDRIGTLVYSNGADNPFPNHLLGAS